MKNRKHSDERLSTGRMMLLRKSPRQKLPEIGKWFVSYSTDYIYTITAQRNTFRYTFRKQNADLCVSFRPSSFSSAVHTRCTAFSERKLSPKNHKNQLQNLFLGHGRHELLQIEWLEICHVLGFALRQQFRSRNQH